MIYILSFGVSTLIILRIPQKLSVFSNFFCFFSPHLSCLSRLSSSYGDAFLNHAAKIIIKQTFCWSIITNNSFCQVEVAKTCISIAERECKGTAKMAFFHGSYALSEVKVCIALIMRIKEAPPTDVRAEVRY